jgi:hypothetical protein
MACDAWSGHLGLCGAFDSILFAIGSPNFTIGFCLSRLTRAATLPQSDDRRAFQTSPTFIGYGNVVLGKLDKGERFEL